VASWRVDATAGARFRCLGVQRVWLSGWALGRVYGLRHHGSSTTCLPCLPACLLVFPVFPVSLSRPVVPEQRRRDERTKVEAEASELRGDGRQYSKVGHCALSR
jgi:hypothetical protein